MKKWECCNGDDGSISERYDGHVCRAGCAGISRGGEGKDDSGTIMEFVKSEYETGGFGQKLSDDTEEGSFIQEGASYHKKLQRVFETARGTILERR